MELKNTHTYCWIEGGKVFERSSRDVVRRAMHHSCVTTASSVPLTESPAHRTHGRHFFVEYSRVCVPSFEFEFFAYWIGIYLTTKSDEH